MICDRVKDNNAKYLGLKDLEDGFLGLSARRLTDCTLIVDIEVLKDSQFWDDMIWETAEE